MRMRQANKNRILESRVALGQKMSPYVRTCPKPKKPTDGVMNQISTQLQFCGIGLMLVLVQVLCRSWYLNGTSRNVYPWPMAVNYIVMLTMRGCHVYSSTVPATAGISVASTSTVSFFRSGANAYLDSFAIFSSGLNWSSE